MNPDIVELLPAKIYMIPDIAYYQQVNSKCCTLIISTGMTSRYHADLQVCTGEPRYRGVITSNDIYDPRYRVLINRYSHVRPGTINKSTTEVQVT